MKALSQAGVIWLQMPGLLEKLINYDSQSQDERAIYAWQHPHCICILAAQFELAGAHERP